MNSIKNSPLLSTSVGRGESKLSNGELSVPVNLYRPKELWYVGFPRVSKIFCVYKFVLLCYGPHTSFWLLRSLCVNLLRDIINKTVPFVPKGNLRGF